MTPEEIRKERERIEAEVRKLTLKIAHLRLDREHLELECKHPHEHATSCMGESGSYCPDCGRST
ncbi:hypothetical protein HY632_04595 [Candidatus Uhrbacteria bacterium]|nr:hypothetical protein [Candidatus Uhrbacteria bacterium]